MCFSATASFSAAAATAVIAVATLRHVKQPRDLPLATVPLLFALQQAVEGMLWLQLSDETGGGDVRPLSFVFLIFAEVLWPTYTAVAVLLVEPDRRRQRALYAVALIGGILSVNLLMNLLGNSPVAAIRGHSIAYTSDVNALSWQEVPYLLCTCLPLLLSSHRIIRIFGAVVLSGFLVSAYVYFATFVSVWCFFAAGDSTLLYFYFKQVPMSVRFHHT